MGLFSNKDARIEAFQRVLSSREALKSQEEFVAQREAKFLRLIGWKAQNPYYWYKYKDTDTEMRPKAVNLAVADLTEMLINKVK